MTRISLLLAVVLVATACSAATDEPEGPTGTQPQEVTTTSEAPDAGETTTSETADDVITIKVAALYPTSGDLASAGTNALNGVKLAADILNGNRPDIDIEPMKGVRVELVPADTQGDPQVGSSEVDRLVRNEGVAAIVGSYQSAVSLTASERAESFGIPFVNGASGAATLSDRGLEWWFRTGPTLRDMLNTWFQWLDEISDAHPVESIAIVNMNDEAGNDFAAQVVALAEANNVQVLDQQRFEPGATDLTSQVQRLRSADPDAIFVQMFIRDTDLFLNTMEELDYTPPALLAGGGGWDDPTFIDVVGDLGEFNIRAVPWGLQLTEQNELAGAVAAEFNQEFGIEMNGDSARTFMAMITLGRALESAASAEPGAIRDALRATNISETIMPWEGVRFDERGQNEAGTYLVLQLQNGIWEAIYPVDIATAEVVWPMPSFRDR